MRTFIATTFVISLIGVSVALAQGAGNSGSPANPPAATNSPAAGNAPIGHRQPRANEVPSNAEKGYQESAEDKALDRKIKSICRGC